MALAVFLTSMTAGRVLGTGLLDRHGRVPVLRALLALAAVGCLLVVFANATLAFVGAVLWGLGASMGLPVGISAAADDQRGAARRISVVSTIGYTAFLAGPPLLGWLGDHRCAERPARGGRDAGGRLLRDAGGGPAAGAAPGLSRQASRPSSSSTTTMTPESAPLGARYSAASRAAWPAPAMA